jgi:hypothetical protein
MAVWSGRHDIPALRVFPKSRMSMVGQEKLDKSSAGSHQVCEDDRHIVWL